MPDSAIEQLIAKFSVYERNLRSMVDRVVAIENKLGIRSLSVFETVVQWPSRIQPQPCVRCDGELVDGERHECKAEPQCTRSNPECDLCHGSGQVYAPTRIIGNPMEYSGCPKCKDRRRSKPDAFEQSLREERKRELDADPCSCDEALELRRKLEEMLDTIRKIDIEAHATYDYRQNMNRVRNLARAALKR